MKTVLTALSILAGLLVIALASARLSGQWDALLPAEPIAATDFETLTPKPTPNTYLVCPEGVCAATPDRLSPRVPLPPAKAVDRLIEIARQHGATQIERVDDLAAEMVVRTPLLRWPDRVSVRAYAAEGAGSELALYSRSKYGRSDLGANRERVEGWLRALEEAG